jgi:hypothetical protein
MDNTVTDAVVKEPSTRPTDKEVMDALIKQAKFAEDYYLKLVSEFQENLRKKYFNL